MDNPVRAAVNFLLVTLGIFSAAFVLIHPLSDVHGGVTKKPALH